MRLHALSASLALTTLMGCGGSKPPPASPYLPTIVRTSATRPAMVQMATDLLAREICDRMRNQFLALAEAPADPNARNLGDEPVGGRWWVRECQAGVSGGHLGLVLDGVGWTWVHRSKLLFDFEQYAFFHARTSVLGDVDIDYDERQRVVMLRFAPLAAPDISGSSIGSMHAGGFSNAVTFGLFSGFAENSAASKVTEAVQQTASERIAAGFVILYSIDLRQVVAFAPNARSPLFPFTDGRRWLANEHQVLRTQHGSRHILGPYAPAPAISVDFIVRGGNAHYRLECSNDLLAWMLPATEGRVPSFPPPSPQRSAVLPIGPTTASFAMACPWYLVTEAAGSMSSVDVRVRADATTLPLPGP